VQKAVAARLFERHELPSSVEKLRITNKQRKDGAFSLASLKRQNYSTLKSAQWIWIRTADTESLLRVANLLGIRYTFASAKTIRVDSIGRKYTEWKSCGLVVDIRDACLLITSFRPNLVEERRALVYDNDDH